MTSFQNEFIMAFFITTLAQILVILFAFRYRNYRLAFISQNIKLRKHSSDRLYYRGSTAALKHHGVIYKP